MSNFLTKTLSSQEHSACGVGFIASRHNSYSHDTLSRALLALSCVEHRGACGPDMISSDGAGIMTDIPFELLGFKQGEVAVATLFLPQADDIRRKSITVFEKTFEYENLKILGYRTVPVNKGVLGSEARDSMPVIRQAFIQRPRQCRTDESFNRLLHLAKQKTRTKEKDAGIVGKFFFASLSSSTIVYKGLTRSDKLSDFYIDLQNPAYKTRFALFHRRFSTNTRTSWDKAQPFRFIAHNGEINTISGNRAWAFSREHSLGIPEDELLTHGGISDSGSLNEFIEALKYRSGIPHTEDILAITIPPAGNLNSFYKFWARAVEPWDGPAFICYSDGQSVGARLDRNGFRPCRWQLTDDYFCLASESGLFRMAPEEIRAQGALHAGTGAQLDLVSGALHLRDPSESRENRGAHFEPRLFELQPTEVQEKSLLGMTPVFGYSKEDYERILSPMSSTGKEPIGSMGDTAALAILGQVPRSFFDFFSHNFAQVTNPPVDYLRESIVTDLSITIGERPNIFYTRELLPPMPAFSLPHPFLSREQMSTLDNLQSEMYPAGTLTICRLDTTFPAKADAAEIAAHLNEKIQQTSLAVESGCPIVIVDDRNASKERLPLPSLLVVSALVRQLNSRGTRLKASIVVCSGEVRSTHHATALIAFGASAVCPYLALEACANSPLLADDKTSAEIRENNYLMALRGGLLKIMSKMGISVLKSYHGSRLMTAVGLDQSLMDEFFPDMPSLVGGVTFADVVERVKAQVEFFTQSDYLERAPHLRLLAEHPKGSEGERHNVTAADSREVHNFVRAEESALPDAEKKFSEFLNRRDESHPVSIRDLLALKQSGETIAPDLVEDIDSITSRFGSGAMSFGAISAESQRDIFLAMRELGGRSNSGEGGENPYYFSHGISATTKQVASGRFGVTPEYLANSKEIQIKIAQGAKPGEGGQLMAVKVDETIARMRYSKPNVDLISPPPMHDIYSIEDLKELIYEFRQFAPHARISVKLVSSHNVGTVAVGVAKAGADIIHISGHEGGTGAASISSMKHAGLPWEFGLLSAHRLLLENDLRQHVTLRTDGGLFTARDVLVAAALGAEEYDFGKLLLIAEGCIMARICEKNTCPTGIATHQEKFKGKYKGKPEHIVRLLRKIAGDIKDELGKLGISSIDELVGRTDLLCPRAEKNTLIKERNIDLSWFLEKTPPTITRAASPFKEDTSPLNQQIVRATWSRQNRKNDDALVFEFPICNTDRAVPATLAGIMATAQYEDRLHALKNNLRFDETKSSASDLCFKFTGDAGQGFGVFLFPRLDISLVGTANDSVCKGMRGGRAVINPPANLKVPANESVIIGNCALYGATGGKLYVHGCAGDRFAVRNSGATAVVEGCSLHACEYMTGGTVIILGHASHNVGAGMTGGEIYMLNPNPQSLNFEYITPVHFAEEDDGIVRAILNEYFSLTGSKTAEALLNAENLTHAGLVKLMPAKLAERPREIPVPSRHFVEECYVRQ